MPRQPLNIVILGGSFAGLSIAHHFLDCIIHQLRTFENAPTYRVVLVSPSTHLYWNICAPRALVSSTLIHTEDAFVPIEPAFARHPFNEFTFMQGWATAVDTSARKVNIELVTNPSKSHSEVFKASSLAESSSPAVPIIRDTSYRPANADMDSKTQTISYHALIIATGSSAHSPLYSLHGTHKDTISELHNFHSRLETAHSIIIVGGGPSGVETAGQLAVYYNQPKKWRKWKAARPKTSTVTDESSIKRATRLLYPSKRSKRDSGISADSSTMSPVIQVTPEAPATRLPKTITLLSGGDRLLAKLDPKTGKRAEKKLKKLGVHVVHNLRQLGATTNADGRSNCILNNDMTITSDLIIHATGVYPNTRFLPNQMLDGNGYVIADRETLRVHGQSDGERIYAIGDCAAYSKNCILDVYETVPVVMKNLCNDLLAYEYRLQTVTSAPIDSTLLKVAENPAEPSLSSTHLSSNNAPKHYVDDRPPSPTLPHMSLTMRPRLSFHAPLPSSLTTAKSPIFPSKPPSVSRTSLLTSEEARKKIDALVDAHFHQNPTDTQIMPISRYGGVGVVFDWRLPSLLVWAFKGKDYKVGRAKGVVGRGINPFGVKR